ncbi:Ion channel, partial [Ancylostoma caninum]
LRPFQSNFIDALKEELLNVVIRVHDRLSEYNRAYAWVASKFDHGCCIVQRCFFLGITRMCGNYIIELIENLHSTKYIRILYFRSTRQSSFGFQTVYWYTLSIFYLTENETHKAMALRPQNAESMWRQHFESNFGRIHALRNYTDQVCHGYANELQVVTILSSINRGRKHVLLALRCWEIGVEGAYMGWQRPLYKKKINESMSDYNVAVGLDNVLTPVWTFWNAMFLAVTTYTTIGYGNITAKTRLGKLAAMVYAVIGIPLVLMILHKLGRFFLLALEHVWDFVMRGAEYLCFVSSGSRLKLSEEERISEMPLLLAIGVAFGWMFLCAAIFLRFEKDWDYFKSFYFFFCSLTTIGYGDVTPTKSEDMFIIFGLIMIGLSLVSMCINVIQLKLEKLFEELLLTLMEEYSSDPEGNNLKGGQIGMIEMWRVWKKRKSRLRNGLAPARQAAGKASQNLAKVIPFARRRDRHHLIEELHHRLRMKDRATQTDFIFGPILEEAWTETSDVDSYTTSCSVPYGTNNNGGGFLLEAPNNLVVAAPSRCESHPVVVQAEQSLASSSQSQSTNHISSRNSKTSSAKSAPIPVSPAQFPVDFDPSRRWTFIGTGKTPRGAPRGLVVPYMYTARQVTNTTSGLLHIPYVLIVTYSRTAKSTLTKCAVSLPSWMFVYGTVEC